MKFDAKSYRAALYMRLSKDDGLGESASIGAQRKMLRAFARENGFEVYGEYADDGWSGTNFDRPSWNRLLSDIENQAVNLVITKDLSRLGRDYIAAGQYTEIYFPARGVRYIAVNDGYDSDNTCTDIVPFKNIINEMYARDTSRKIRSAFRTKMAEGAFIGNFAPYGYVKDPENRNHLLIDYTASPVVQEIFRRAEEGASPSEIAGSLNARGVITPAAYRRCRRPGPDSGDHPAYGIWTSGMICKMLCNVVYLGHIAQGKTTKASFKSPATLRNPREAWIVAEGRHDPLVTQETFENVRKRSVARRRPPKTGFINAFSGIAKCAGCGRGMSATGSRRKDGAYDLVCGGYKLQGRGACSNHVINYETLCQVVQAEIRTLLALSEAEKTELLAALAEMSAREERPEKTRAADALATREKELDRIIGRLYEDNAGGRLDDARFYKLLAAYETEQRDISARLASFSEQAAEEPAEEDLCRAYAALLREITEPPELTPGLLRGLIDRIEVCQGGFENDRRGGRKHQTVRIYYKFAAPEAADGSAENA